MMRRRLVREALHELGSDLGSAELVADWSLDRFLPCQKCLPIDGAWE